jgi:hypothetical protein
MSLSMRLTLLILCLMALFLSGVLVLADCQLDNTSDITCDDSPTDTDGTTGTNGDDTVTVEAGASVSNDGAPAIDTEAGNDEVENNGTVSASDADAISSDGDLTVSGNGTVEVSGDGDYYGSTTAAIHSDGDITVEGNISINADGTAARGIDAGGDVTVAGNVEITSNGSFSTGIHSTEDITIDGDVEITSTGDHNRMGIRGSDVTINGNVTIHSSGGTGGGDGIIADDYPFDEPDGLTVNGSVDITMEDGGIALNSFSTVDVSGSANIHIENWGIGILADEETTLEGTITIYVEGDYSQGVLSWGDLVIGENTSVEVVGDANTHGVTIGADATNAGVIIALDGEGLIATNYDTDNVVLNTGTISGGEHSVVTGRGNDSVTNQGTLNGDVDLGTGDDSFSAQGGAVNGNIDGGDGYDVIILQFSYTASSQDEYDDLHDALTAYAANGGSGTIQFGDTVYEWSNFEEFVDLVDVLFTPEPDPDPEQEPNPSEGEAVVITIDVNRINYLTPAAPMAGFCLDGGVIDLYAINSGIGEFVARVTPDDIFAALDGESGFLAGTELAGLSLVDSTTLQLSGPGGYFYTFPVDYCGLPLPVAP